MKKAILYTSMPSPYMVELIDKVNALDSWNIATFYGRPVSPGRRWKVSQLRHGHYFVENICDKTIQKIMADADLAVICSLWGTKVSRFLRTASDVKIPLILWAERPGLRFNDKLTKFARDNLVRYRFRRVAALWGIGTWAVTEYKRIFPRLQVCKNMPYASNLERFLSVQNSRQALKEKGLVRFLFSGSLIRRKGVDLLVEEFVRVLSEGANVMLTLMGCGEMKDTLRRAIPREYSEEIQFIGFKEWWELPDIYAAHNVLIAPSRYDGWGLVVLEGLAAGMPVIATDKMGAALDFICHGENGWIVAAGVGEKLRSAIKEAYQAPLVTMGERARTSAMSWTLARAANRWCTLADEVVEKVSYGA